MKSPPPVAVEIVAVECGTCAIDKPDVAVVLAFCHIVMAVGRFERIGGIEAIDKTSAVQKMTPPRRLQGLP